MSGKLFGTDGVRGLANQDVTPELAFQIGQGAGLFVGAGSHVVIGRDTRQSGTMLGAALCAGLCSVGVSPHTLGVFPTGGVSWITRTAKFALGAVISASHNPAEDNGIKFFGSDGRKATAEMENFIENQIGRSLDSRPLGTMVGAIETQRGESNSYCDWLVSLVPEGLEGMSVAMDCAHGSAFEIAPKVFERLGAKLTVGHAHPDGKNINLHCGATKPEVIRELSRKGGDDLGVAFDGDADRAVFSDSKGRLINGDRTMAIWAQHWRSRGQFDPAIVVGTLMSNTGFERYLEAEGIQLTRVGVGDKYVSAKLDEINGQVGGEQSGHIIFPEFGPTGDGLVTALQLARVLMREGKSATELYESFENWPQLLLNVKVDRKDGWETDPAVVEAIAKATQSVGSGRVNVRASGTQPMIRVMVEGPDQAVVEAQANSVVDALITSRGGSIYSRVDLAQDLGE